MVIQEEDEKLRKALFQTRVRVIIKSIDYIKVCITQVSRLRLQRRLETEGKESVSVARRSVDHSEHSHSSISRPKTEEKENMEEKSDGANELGKAWKRYRPSAIHLSLSWYYFLGHCYAHR